MKTPDEIKKGLLCCSHSDMPCSECPYDGICNTDSGETPEDDAVGLIDQLLSSYSQVSKALCGKENATLEEVLHAVSQLKSRLAQVERERDAAVHDLTLMAWNADEGIACIVCGSDSPLRCEYCKNRPEEAFIWRGVCEKNAKEDSTC